MNLDEVKKIVKSAKLSKVSKQKVDDVIEQMKKEGVTDYLRGHLVRIIEDEAKVNEEEVKYFKDLNMTLGNFLEDVEKRLNMANEEIEESAK